MTTASLVVVLFGVFNIIGGILGWVRVKSKASIIAGSISGALLLLAAMGMNDGMGFSYVIGLIISAALGIRFTKNWFKTKRTMPDLVIVILSIITLIAVLFEMSAR